MTKYIVFNENINEYEIANFYGVDFDTNSKEYYTIFEDDLKLIPRNLKYPAIYKDFKNEYYVVMGISEPVCEINLSFDITETARYTEDTNSFSIYYFKKENKYVHLCENSKDILVIYRPLHLGVRQLYARPLDVFLSEVDRNIYPNAEQRFRFEEVQYYE